MNKYTRFFIRTGAAVVLLAFPTLGHATAYYWKSTSTNGDFTATSDWTTAPTFSSSTTDNYYVSGAATVTTSSLDGNSDPAGTVNIGGSYLILSNGATTTGSLTVNSGATLDVFKFESDTNASASSTASISGTLNVYAGGLYEGVDGTATLTINSGGDVVTSAVGIGSAGGNGTIINEGTLSDSNSLYVGDSAGATTATFVEQGGVTSATTLYVADYAVASATLKVIGSGGSLTFSSGTGLNAASSAAHLDFTLDSGGITPINASNGSANITGANLAFDLDAGTVGNTYTLIESKTGITDTGFNYTSSSPDIVSNSLGTNNGLDGALYISGDNLVLKVEAVPEPSTVALMGLGLFLLALCFRKRAVAL